MILASPSSDKTAALETMVVWSVVLLAAVIVFGLLIWYYRRWLREDQPPQQQTWTLQELRDLKARGELDELEYQALRKAVLHETGAAQRASSETS